MKPILPKKELLPTDLPASEGEGYADLVLGVALDVGKAILASGGEIARVEDTVIRICHALGGKKVRVFAITSMIEANLTMPDGKTAFSMRRIFSSENNLYRLKLFNSISRRLCSGALSPEDAKAEIEKASTAKPYPEWLLLFGGMLSAGGFAVFFGGNLRDGFAAAIAGFFMILFDKIQLPYVNRMAHTAFNAFIGGCVSMGLWRLGLGQNPDKILIGTVMILIPGLAFGNALRDMLSGNLISGALRTLECLLTAAVIAFGFMGAVALFGGMIL